MLCEHENLVHQAAVYAGSHLEDKLALRLALSNTAEDIKSAFEVP